MSANWDVQWTREAAKDLRKLTPQVADRILEAAESSANTGHGDLVRLKGREPEWRLRVGEW